MQFSRRLPVIGVRRTVSSRHTSPQGCGPVSTNIPAAVANNYRDRYKWWSLMAMLLIHSPPSGHQKHSYPPATILSLHLYRDFPTICLQLCTEIHKELNWIINNHDPYSYITVWDTLTSTTLISAHTRSNSAWKLPTHKPGWRRRVVRGASSPTLQKNPCYRNCKCNTSSCGLLLHWGSTRKRRNTPSTVKFGL